MISFWSVSCIFFLNFYLALLYVLPSHHCAWERKRGFHTVKTQRILLLLFLTFFARKVSNSGGGGDRGSDRGGGFSVSAVTSSGRRRLRTRSFFTRLPLRTSTRKKKVWVSVSIKIRHATKKKRGSVEERKGHGKG